VIVAGETGLFETANLFVRRELFDQLGGFEEWAGVGKPGTRPFGEDAWLGWRARRSGARIEFCREAVVHHAVFPGDPLSYVREHARRRHFPELVNRIPELRGSFCYRNVFLERRTAFFDLAATGVASAALSRRLWPLAGAVPYTVLLARQARQAPRNHRARVGFAGVAADCVGLTALVVGSIRARSLLL
jgi:GT2 family glycosyltransferase